MQALFIIFAFIATVYCLCRFRGKDRSENEKWVENSFLFQCLKTGKGWKTTILGCMVNDKQIAVGTNATFGGRTYVCEGKGDGDVRIRSYVTDIRSCTSLSGF